MKIFVGLCFFGLFAAGFIFAQDNPFTNAKPKDPSPSDIQGAPEGELNVFQSVQRFLVDNQRFLTKQLDDAFRDFQKTGQTGLIWILLVSSFFYGIIHTLLPGHSKGVVISYFIAQKAKVTQGLLAGLLFGALHVLGAVIVVGGSYLILQSTLSQAISDFRGGILIISAICILVLGIVVLIFKIRHLKSHDHHHHDHDHAHHDAEVPKSTRSFWWLMISTAIVPCPGSILIMVAGVSLNAFGLALLSLLAMSLGIGLALCAIGIITILFKSKIIDRLEHSRRGHVLHVIIELGGSFLIILSGIVLLITGTGV